MKIAILAFDNFTDLDLVLHWDILNRVNFFGGVKDWSVKIAGTKDIHISTLGLPIPTSVGLDYVREADGVIICSGKGTRVLLEDKNYLTSLGLDPSRHFIGAQCSGSLILGALGYLIDVKVSGYPPILKELNEYGALPVHQSLVIENKIATASSCLAGQYLSRWLIESLAGKEAADKVMLTVEPL